jgi:hypothetical protein
MGRSLSGGLIDLARKTSWGCRSDVPEQLHTHYPQTMGCTRSNKVQQTRDAGEALARLGIGVAMCLTMGVYGQTVAPPRNGYLGYRAAESKSEKIAYGLSVDDFRSETIAIERQIILQLEMGAQSFSLLFVIQTLHNFGSRTGEDLASSRSA